MVLVRCFDFWSLLMMMCLCVVYVVRSLDVRNTLYKSVCGMFRMMCGGWHDCGLRYWSLAVALRYGRVLMVLLWIVMSTSRN